MIIGFRNNSYFFRKTFLNSATCVSLISNNSPIGFAITYFGKTAQLVQEAHSDSHFQKAVLKIGNYLIILAVALVAVIITVALFRVKTKSNTL
jgi:hypothetical protein